MTGVIFRSCNRAELPAVQQLVDSLYGAVREAHVVTEIYSTFAEFYRHPEKGAIIVFELDRELVGYAILVFFWSNEFGGDVIEIDELCVDERCRRSGIGKQFFRWLESAYPNSVGFALQVAKDNAAAIALYKGTGFTYAKTDYMYKIHSRL